MTGELTEEAQAEATKKDMEIYGHVALSAISGFPLLVVGTTVRTYIHFSQIQGLYDEEDLQQACSFSILTAQTEYRFFSETSTGYQKWVGALSQAFEQMANGGNKDMSFRPMSPDAGSTVSRPMSIMSKDPEDYREAHRAMSVNRAQSRRSLSNVRRKSYVMGGQSETMMSLHGPASDIGSERPLRRKSIFQKVKDFFTGEDSHDPYGSVTSRGRDNHDESTFAGRMRARSKSVARFLGLTSEE
ncbi:hypothetical protein HDV03_003040 [Kappamyces sp. JEL0829]|nr:hypothetical protein HDV03_003040 [Kappamyces sp. JEL0829]